MKQFKIHFSFYLLFLCMILSKYQVLYLKLLALIFLHEIGHIFIASIFKIKINKLILTGMGFFMDAEINDLCFYKSFIFYFSGIIINAFLLIFLKGELRNLNLFIIFINLIPIYPTDGYNIFSSILSYFFPYKKSLYVSRYISLIISCSFFLYFIDKMDLLLFVSLFYLLYLSISLIKNIKFDYERFLLDRYLNNIKLKIKKINYKNNFDDMFYRFKKIEARLSNRMINENELIKIKYKNM